MLVKYLSFANDHLSGQGVKNKRELNLIFYDLSIYSQAAKSRQAGRRVVAVAMACYWWFYYNLKWIIYAFKCKWV